MIKELEQKKRFFFLKSAKQTITEKINRSTAINNNINKTIHSQ